MEGKFREKFEEDGKTVYTGYVDASPVILIIAQKQKPFIYIFLLQMHLL